MPLFVKEEGKDNTNKTSKTKQINTNKYKKSLLCSTPAMAGNSNHLGRHEASHSFAD